MSTLQKMLVGVGLTKRVLVDVGFAKGIGKCWSSKRIQVDDGLASASEVFTGR